MLPAIRDYNRAAARNGWPQISGDNYDELNSAARRCDEPTSYGRPLYPVLAARLRQIAATIAQ